MRLEELRKGMLVEGVSPDGAVTLRDVDHGVLEPAYVELMWCTGSFISRLDYMPEC